MEPISILLLIVGGAISFGFIFVVVFAMNKKRINARCTCKIYGKVIQNVLYDTEDTDGRYRPSWHSLCEYKVGEIRCVRETTLGTYQPKYEVGQVVEIYYNPENCHESYIVGDTYPTFFIVILLFLAVFAIVVLWFLLSQFL